MLDPANAAKHMEAGDTAIAKYERLRRDARELATGVLDLRVGVLAPDEMRAVAGRIIKETDRSPMGQNASGPVPGLNPVAPEGGDTGAPSTSTPN